MKIKLTGGSFLAGAIIALVCFSSFVKAQIPIPPQGAIGAGTSYSLVLDSNGKISASGLNTNGQLGVGSWLTEPTPVTLSGISSVVAISPGTAHSLALRSDGTVWAWGSNANGQLGDGTIVSELTPGPVPNLANFKSVAAGGKHSLALRSDGTVWAWGSNAYGQLGDGTTVQRVTPVNIPGLTNIIAIAAGTSHCLALRSDGTVWAWGLNTNGQLGDGSTTTRLVPVNIITLSGVVAISAGMSHSVAIKSDGSVAAWGLNANGQLGDGSLVQRLSPVTLSGFSQVTAISAGARHTVALRLDGSVWAWGFNGDGELGNGTTVDQKSPQQIPNIIAALAVAAGANHTLVLENEEFISAFGSNLYGQFGNGTAPAIQSTPTLVNGVNNVTNVYVGTSHTLAIETDHTIWAWGLNTNGQVGDGSTIQRNQPTKLGISNILTAAAGGAHSLAVTSDGSVQSWGKNTNGQLGDGSTIQRNSPVVIPSLSGIISVAAGLSHSLALKSDGSVYAWGLNSNGQLGDGTVVQRSSPAKISGLTGITAISAGDAFSLALKNDGTVWAWGNNSRGQLGDGTTTQRTAPIRITSLSAIIAIAAGSNHSLALSSTTAAFGWGDNTYGELMDGSDIAPLLHKKPFQINTTFTAIAAGNGFTILTGSNGTTYYAGLNTSGQLATTGTRVRGQNDGVPGTRFLAGYAQMFTINSDGTVLARGANESGQLGLPIPPAPQPSKFDPNTPPTPSPDSQQNGDASAVRPVGPWFPVEIIPPPGLFFAPFSLNNHGDVLGLLGPPSSQYASGTPAIWSNGAFTKAPEAFTLDGRSYSNTDDWASFYLTIGSGSINDAKQVLGRYGSNAAVWKDGNVSMLRGRPDRIMNSGECMTYNDILRPLIRLYPGTPLNIGSINENQEVIGAEQGRIEFWPKGQTPIIGPPNYFYGGLNDNQQVVLSGLPNVDHAEGLPHAIWNIVTNTLTPLPAPNSVNQPSNLMSYDSVSPRYINNYGDVIGVRYIATTAGLRTRTIYWQNGKPYEVWDYLVNSSISTDDWQKSTPLLFNNTGDMLLVQRRSLASEPKVYFLHQLTQSIFVDGNKDGVISLTDKNDQPTSAKPYRIWINDDFDSIDHSGVNTTPNYADDQVNGSGDLKDFFPVYLNLKQLLSSFSPESGAVFKLKQADGALKFVYTSLTLDNAFSYRQDSTSLNIAATRQITPAGVELPTYFLNHIRDDNQGVILIEGIAPTEKPLVLSVEQNGVVVAEVSLPLSVGQNIVLLLHGMNSNTGTWNELVDDMFSGLSTDIRDGRIAGPIPQRNASGVRCYRLQFGTYDLASTRTGVEEVTSTNTPGYAVYPARCGDFETFDELGREVDDAITALLAVHPNAKITLVGHSRGGLSARAFLQQPGSSPNKAAVVAFLTTSSPHLGSRLGRINGWLQTHKRGAAGTDPQDWAVVDWLIRSTVVVAGIPTPVSKPPLDVRRPVILDVADDSPAIASLNSASSVQNLPTSVRCGEIIYSNAHFGLLTNTPVRFSVLEPIGVGRVFDQLPAKTCNFILNGASPADLSVSGDGLIPSVRQVYTQLPGFHGIRVPRLVIRDREIVHTQAPHQSTDLINRLKVLIPDWFL